jgi:hypothetical protein
MWIKQMPSNYYEQPSSFSGSVMLWKNEKIYVMDNHLSAIWCWLQSCDPKAEYNFMHIDMHYDLLSSLMKDIQPLRDNPYMSYDKFKNLKRSIFPVTAAMLSIRRLLSNASRLISILLYFSAPIRIFIDYKCMGLFVFCQIFIGNILIIL